ncbi:hypothetical protein BDW69DRAFT_188326 [Aspergillus filifer]
MLEPALNYGWLLHAIGRLHRLGQQEKQKEWILFADYTIDRYLECNNSHKAIPEFAGHLDEKAIDDLIEGGLKTDKDISKAVALGDVYKFAADCAIMKCFVQIRSRMGMKYSNELYRDYEGHPTRYGNTSSSKKPLQLANCNFTPSSTKALPSGGNHEQWPTLKRPAADDLQGPSRSRN